MNLLLVEENSQSSIALMAALRGVDDQYNIIHVTTMMDALSALEARPELEAALVDLDLPDASELEAPSALCSSKPNLVVVALTVRNDSRLEAQALRLGAQDYLIKGQHNPLSIDRALRHSLERHRREQSIRNAVYRDELTGVLNRRGLDAVLSSLSHEDHSLAKNKVALFSLDLDGFKQVNDTYGHPAGDHLLIQCARRLSGNLRKADSVARIGGDEFVIVCKGVASVEAARAIGEQLVTIICAPISMGKTVLQVSASAGGAHLPGDTDDVRELIRLSDAALYVAKRSGKNTCALHSDTQTPETLGHDSTGTPSVLGDAVE